MLWRIQARSARDQHQHHHGRQVGDHAEEVALDLHAPLLQVKLQHGQPAEEVGAEQDPRRAPGRERRQRQRDPAAPGDQVLDPEVRVGERDVGAGQAAHGAAEDHRREPDCADAVAERVRRLGRLAHRAKQEASARPEEEPAQRDGEEHGPVDERVIAEQGGSDHREIPQPGKSVAATFRELLVDERRAREGGETDAEQTERQPGRVLVRADPDRQPPEQRRHRRPRARGGEVGHEHPPSRKVQRRRVASQRANEHHPLGAEVQDARAFIDQKPQPGEREHGPRVDRGREHEREATH